MGIVITENLILAQRPVAPSFGILAYRSNVSFSNIAATSETSANPATNMANPLTAFSWVASSTATQTITIDNDNQEVDYIAFARHNLNQPGLTVTVSFDGSTVIDAVSVGSAQAVFYQVNTAAPTTITMVISGATTAPTIAVLYAGLSTTLERGIYVGHTPISYGRDRSTINGVSENGQYLGEVVIRENFSTSVSLNNLTASWYRNTLDPYFALKPRRPCFWVWYPDSYPSEVGYCWVEGNPRPVNQRNNGMMQISWNFRGIA